MILSDNQIKQRGFTLVEVLVVLAISGLLTGLMVTGFRTVQSGWQQIATRDAAHDDCNASRHFLRSLLSQAYPAMVDGSTAQPVVDFSGQPDQASFLGPLPQRFGASDIVRYTLHFTKDRALHLAWRLDRHIAEGFLREADSDTTLTVSRARSGFSYYGADDQGKTGWQGDWSERRTLPELIRVGLAPCGGASGDLLIPLSITQGVCATSLSGRCGA